MKERALKLGAQVVEGGVEFGVWAPKAKQVDVQIDNPSGTVEHPLEARGDGVFAGTVAGIGAGTLYRYRLDGGEAYPDPRSRFQPEGVHGPSEVIDFSTFTWTDQDWPGIDRDHLIIYELHVGTYTTEGTFAALTEQLDELKSLGVTALELMPIAEFPGRWNWGYDGADWFAPTHNYGRPDDLNRLIDAAHRAGLAVLLDVVYNHFGPDGSYWRAFSDDYFTDRHRTNWGDAINYDGPNARFVRDFVLDNVRQWIADYHFDGMRLDATDTIMDESRPDILQEIEETARAAASGRHVVVIAEDARNDVRLIRPVSKGGDGLDAVWADDFHHELRVYLSNARENYYQHFQGALSDVATAINDGFAFQGQPSLMTGQARGTRVTDEPASAFVFCLQNHDQIGNRPFGDRVHHEIEHRRFMVATALLLLAPEAPMIFMGQEFDASTPFLYFTDHQGELGRLVTEGRRNEFSGFRLFADESLRAHMPDPQAPSSFFDSKLILDERFENAETYAYYKELLRLRREDPVLSNPVRHRAHAEAIGVHRLSVHRWKDDEHRLLIANFGHAAQISLDFVSVANWTMLLSSGERRFGGNGRVAEIAEGQLIIPARSATLFAGR